MKRRWIKIKTHDIAFRTAHRGGDFFTAFIDLNTESEIFKGMEEIEIPKDIEIEDSKTGKSKIEVDKDSVIIGEFIYFKNNYVNFYVMLNYNFNDFDTEDILNSIIKRTFSIDEKLKMEEKDIVIEVFYVNNQETFSRKG